jgi:hypothetical protein
MHRRPIPLLLALAGAAWTAGQAVLPDMGTEWPERLDAVAADRGGQALSAALFVVAGGLLVTAAVVAGPHLRAGRGGRLVRAGLVLVALGGVWLAAGRGAFNLQMYRVSDPALERSAALDVLGSDIGPGFAALLLTLPALLLGPVVLAAGAIRAGAGAPAWAALACWVVGVGAFVGAEFSVKAVEVAGIGVATVGLALLGAVVVRASAPARPTAEPEPARQG